MLVALTVVLVKDREFWFGWDAAVESNTADSESNPQPAAKPAKSSQVPAAQVATPKNHTVPKSSSQAVTDRSRSEAPGSAPANSAAPAVATKRVALPPLDVEVVAGDTHRIVHSGSNVAKVEIPAVAAPALTLQTNAAERVRLSSASAPELQQTLETTYPLLGQHSRVQGSVVLQAVVGTDGTIENLRVVSGPAVLATAAQQAVRQWRFKPYLQDGQPVETKARITVNFTIRISDDAKTS
jgi:TonB family protein